MTEMQLGSGESTCQRRSVILPILREVVVKDKQERTRREGGVQVYVGFSQPFGTDFLQTGTALSMYSLKETMIT